MPVYITLIISKTNLNNLTFNIHTSQKNTNLFLASFHLDDEVCDAVVWQRLPGADVRHLGLHQTHVAHVGVGRGDPLYQLKGETKSLGQG